MAEKKRISSEEQAVLRDLVESEMYVAVLALARAAVKKLDEQLISCPLSALQECRLRADGARVVLKVFEDLAKKEGKP